MERRYRDTDSSSVREELAGSLQPPLPRVRGTRLRRDARHVFVDERTLPSITACRWARPRCILNSFDWRAARARSPTRS